MLLTFARYTVFTIPVIAGISWMAQQEVTYVIPLRLLIWLLFTLPPTTPLIS